MAFELFKGQEWRWRGRCTDDETGDRTDLTGLPIVFELRQKAGGAPLITLTIGDGVEELPQAGDTLGEVDFVIAALKSTGLKSRNHHVLVKVDGRIVLGPLKLPVRDL